MPDLPESAQDEQIISAVRGHLSQSDLELQVVRYPRDAFAVRGLDERSRLVAGEYAAGTVIWIDLREDGYTILLWDDAGDRLFRRRVPVAEGAHAAALEGVANITGSALAEPGGDVRGMVEVDPVEVKPEPKPKDPESKPKPEPKPKPKSPSTPRPEPTWARLWFSAVYAGNTFADTVPWQSGIGLGFAYMPVPRVYLGARYDVVFASKINRLPVVFELRRHPVLLVGGYRYPLGPKWDLEIFGRVGVDPVLRHSDETASSAPVTGPRLRWFSGAQAGIGVGYSPIRQLRLAISLGAEVLFTRADYVSEGPTRTLLEPHPARFVVDAGLHFGTLFRPRRKRRQSSKSH